MRQAEAEFRRLLPVRRNRNLALTLKAKSRAFRSDTMAWLIAEFAEQNTKPEQRGEARRELSLSLKARVSKRHERVLVLDLSRAGMLIHTQTELACGEVFRVELPEAGEIEARVAWKRQSLYGCEFCTPVSKAAVSAALLKATHARPGSMA